MQLVLSQHPVDSARHDRHPLGIDALLAELSGESRREHRTFRSRRGMFEASDAMER